MGTYAPVQDHRDACGCPMHLGRGEGRWGSSSLLGSRGQRGRSGLVRVMRCSENGDSLVGLQLRSADTGAHPASAVDAGRPEREGAPPQFRYTPAAPSDSIPACAGGPPEPLRLTVMFPIQRLCAAYGLGGTSSTGRLDGGAASTGRQGFRVSARSWSRHSPIGARCRHARTGAGRFHSPSGPCRARR